MLRECCPLLLYIVIKRHKSGEICLKWLKIKFVCVNIITIKINDSLCVAIFD